MPRKKPSIVLFEDDQTKNDKLVALMRRRASARFSVEAFDPAALPANAGGAYEDQLVKAYDGKEIILFVTDRDLSKSKQTPGLSETNVSRAAALMGKPVCVYAAGRSDSVLDRQRSGGDGRIILDSSDQQVMAQKIVTIARGFQDLAAALGSARKKKTKGPGSLLALALGQPEIAPQIALYASGDQRMIAELMWRDERERPETAATALGTWFYDSVLHFPGILVNETAAASFLNIAQKQFDDTKVRALFSDALYRGPFSDPNKPSWWRHILVTILEKAGAEDGRVLAKKKLKKDLLPCACSVDRKAPSGFFCAVTHKPVCKQHSTGQVGWLPRGADLTRVTNDVFDELSPWIGAS